VRRELIIGKTVKVAIRDVQLPPLLSNAVIRSTRINRVRFGFQEEGFAVIVGAWSAGGLQATVYPDLLCAYQSGFFFAVHLSRSLEPDLIRTATSINLTLVYSVPSPSDAPDVFEGVPGLLFLNHNFNCHWHAPRHGSFPSHSPP
jgi:hypothetical protein